LVAKRVAGVAGSAAGSAAGGFLNNPGAVAAIGIVVAIVTSLLIFRKDISEFFSGLGNINIELPTIEFPDITFPDFPDITFPDFPDFPDFTSIFENFFNQFQFGNGDGGPGPVPPGEIGDSGVTLPPGCFIDDQGRLDCPSPPTFDACAEFPDLPQCQPEEPEQLPPGFVGPPGPGQQECFDIPVLTGGTFNSCTGEFTPPVAPEPVPGPTLPPGFVGGGPSFEGGTIFETTDESCTTLSCVIDRNPGFSASQAADRLAEILGTFGDFDFGTNTGSGFGPGDDPTGPIVTGGATLESEAQRAACTSCDLFGLNCPICRGEIGA